MPAKDPEKFREYQREQMKRRRAQAKAATNADSTSLSAVETSSPSTKSESSSLSTPKVAPAPASQIEEKVTKVNQGNPIAVDMESAKVVGAAIKERLETKGWCKVRATLLNNDIIVVIRDEEVTDYPKGFPVYTDDEMKEVAHLTLDTIKRIHFLKKKTQCQILPGFESALQGG